MRVTHANLVGTEQVRKTQADGEALREARKINLSLSALGNVIQALTGPQRGSSRHIPYRDSKVSVLLSTNTHSTHSLTSPPS